MDRLPAFVPTERLTLRLWTPEDAAAMGQAVTESLDHLRPWMPWTADEPLSVEARRELIGRFEQDWATGGDAIYGTFLGGTVVGGCGLHRRQGPGVLEIGYWLHVDHLHRGYATELADALTETALAVPGIERVEIHHDRANHPSRRVPERLGFTFEGETADQVRAGGEVGIDCTWSTTQPGPGRDAAGRTV